MKKIIYIIINMLIIFAPKFRFFNQWTWLIAMLGVLTIFDLNFVKKYGVLSKPFVLMCTLIFTNIGASLIVPVLHQTYDFSYLTLLLGLLLSVLRALFLVYLLKKFFNEKATSNLYINCFVNSCMIFVLITILFILMPGVKNWWFEKVIEPVTIVEWGVYAYRIGLSGFAAFSTSVIFSVAILLNTYLLLLPNIGNKVFIKTIFSYIINLIGCFLYGRVSIFAIILSVLFIFIFSKNKKRAICILLVLGSLLGIIISIIFVEAENNAELFSWTQWSFQLFLNFFESGQIRSSSLTHMLEDMYFIPSLNTLFIGDGQYFDGLFYYMYTDVGFMRQILFFGIFGLLINYSSYIVIVSAISRYFKILKRRNGVILTIMFLLIMIILELKGEAFHRILYCILPIYCLTYKEKNIYLKNNINSK